MTVPSTSAFLPAQHLAWGDVSDDSHSAPTMLKVHLMRSKCDKVGKGMDIYMGRTKCPLCPVFAGVTYMADRGASTGPFFIKKDETPLTKPAFVSAVRQAIQATGHPYKDYAGHSFHIGVATTAAKVGIEDSTIHALGRWNSAVFLCYIRTPQEQLANQLAKS